MPEAFAPVNESQAAFMADLSRYVLASGGWGSGKSICGAQKLAEVHLLNAGVVDGSPPTFVKSLIVAPTYQVAHSVCIPEMRRALDRIGLRNDFIADPKRSCFELPDLGTKSNPSEILVRVGEAADRITGFEVGAFWSDETARQPWSEADPLKDAMLQCYGRLRDSRAKLLQAIFTTTMEGAAHRVWRDFVIDPKPGHRVHFLKTADNPHRADFAAEQRKQLSPELAAQYLDGLALDTGGGRVYGQFERESNVDPSLILTPHLPLQLAIDFNINPGCHALIGQWHEREKLFTSVCEIHGPRMDVRGVVNAFRDLVASLGGWQWPALHVYGDASGQAKHSATSESCVDVLLLGLHNLNIPYELRMRSRNPAIGDRVNAANLQLRGIDGRVGWKIHPRCERLITDLRTLHWKDGTIDKSDRNRSHASDADTYRIHYHAPPIRHIETEGQVGFSAPMTFDESNRTAGYDGGVPQFV